MPEKGVAYLDVAHIVILNHLSALSHEWNCCRAKKFDRLNFYPYFLILLFDSIRVSNYVNDTAFLFKRAISCRQRKSKIKKHLQLFHVMPDGIKEWVADG